MGVAAGRIVLLEDTNLPVQFSQQRRGGQTAHARADDDGIVAWCEAIRAIATTDAQGRGFHPKQYKDLLPAGRLGVSDSRNPPACFTVNSWFWYRRPRATRSWKIDAPAAELLRCSKQAGDVLEAGEAAQ